MKLSHPLLIKWLTRGLLVATLFHMGSIWAQSSLQPGKVDALLERRRQVVRFEDVGQLQLDDSPEIPIRVVYYNGKSDVALDSRSLKDAIRPLITPEAFQLLDQSMSGEWITFKTLKEWGYRCQFSKLTLAISIDIPVAYRTQQEVSLKPRVKIKPIKITHRPATLSGYLNVGGSHEITPDTMSTAFENGYALNGMVNLSQNIVKWGLIKPIPKEIKSSGFDNIDQVTKQSSREWVLTDIQLRHNDYANQWMYLLGDIQSNPNEIIPLPSMWGVGLHSIPRSKLADSGGATTTFELELSENAEVIFVSNDKPIFRIKRKAGRHRFVDIPLTAYFNELLISVVPETNTRNVTQYRKIIYHDPGALPPGVARTRFQLGSPLDVSVQGRGIDAQQLVGIYQILVGVGHSTMVGGNISVQHEQFKVGVDYVGITPFGGLEVHPQFEQVATQSMAHLLLTWNLFDPNKSLLTKAVGLNWLSKINNIPLSDTGQPPEMSTLTMSNGVQVDWQVLSNFKLQTSLLHIMASNQHRLFGYINSNVDWGWARWGASTEISVDSSKKKAEEQLQIKWGSNVGASIIKGLDVQVGAYYGNDTWGMSTGLIWKPMNGFNVLQKQFRNTQLYAVQQTIDSHTQIMGSYQQSLENDGLFKTMNQVQLSQGTDEEQLQLGWEWVNLTPSKRGVTPSKTPNTILHNLLYRSQRMEAKFMRSDYNEDAPEQSILSWGTALVFADGEWGISKPIDSGFMLLRVNSNVYLPTIYVNDRRLSDGLGATVYQQLNPYQVNRLQLNAESNGQYLGGRQVTIKPYPYENYMVDLDVSKRTEVTFQVSPYHRRKMMGQRIMVERLDGGEEPMGLLIGADNRINIDNIYAGKYRIRFGDTRLGEIMLKVPPVTPDRVDLGVVELGQKQVVLYVN